MREFIFFCAKIFIIICFFFPQSVFSADQKDRKIPNYIFYTTKSGDTLYNIFLRLNVGSLENLKVHIDQTLKWNGHIKEQKNGGGLLLPNQEIVLPIVFGDSKYKYYRHSQKNYITIPPFTHIKARVTKQPKIMRAPASTIVRQVKPKSSTDKIDNINFDYDCSSEASSLIYKEVGSFLAKNKKHIKNMNISFKCRNSNKNTSNLINPSRGTLVKNKVSTEKIKLKPWMMSFDESVSYEGGSKSKTSFFFPSIGYSTVNYKEGTQVDTNFTNIFLSFRYRNIISRPYWQIDFEAKYGVISTSSDIVNSQAHLLDVDLRVGRAIPLFSEPWKLTLFAGVFYSQMFVKQQLYGYQGIYYPEVYPELRRVFNSGASLSFYLKYMPTGKKLFSTESSNQAFTIGVQYNFDIRGTDIFFNYNHSVLKFTSGSNDTPVELMQHNIGIGGGF